MSSTRIEQLIDDVQAAFDRPSAEIESGLDVDDGALLQLRKACRLLAGAATLRDEGYYTLVIEASFVAIERTVEFRLLERGTMQPDGLPGSHPGVYREAASAGIFAESIAENLADLWRDHRAKTYYQTASQPQRERRGCTRWRTKSTPSSSAARRRATSVSVGLESE